MLQFADTYSLRGYWKEDLKTDYEWVDTIENRMSNYDYKLIPLEMKRCNSLYKKYKVVYEDKWWKKKNPDFATRSFV